jgi:hypothetical protein
MSSFRCEYVRCGKAGCRRCPHGPYWYEYWWESGKTKKRYHGRVDPRSEDSYSSHEVRLDAIFNQRTASADLAREILGVTSLDTREVVLATYRRLSLDTHPDRGGDRHQFARVSAAWSYLRSLHDW